MALGSLQCVKKKGSISKSLKEFCSGAHRLIKNTLSIKLTSRYTIILMENRGYT